MTASVDEQCSVNVGAVRYTERFGLHDAVSPEVLAEALAAISADLARLDGRPSVDALVGMGGAITNLTAVSLGLDLRPGPRPGRGAGASGDRPPDRAVPVHGHGGAPGHRRSSAQAGRGDPGRRLHRANRDGQARRASLVVSDRGLRHGVLEERFGAEDNERSEGSIMTTASAARPRARHERA